MGRGRPTYNSAGPTALSALSTSSFTYQETYHCHDVPLANGVAGQWVAVDLGTARLVRSVRVQALEAFNAASGSVTSSSAAMQASAALRGSAC